MTIDLEMEMDKRTFKGTIFFKMDSKHPDFKHTNDTNKELSYNDTYYIDGCYFNNEEQIINKIEYDLSLVAGGGYNSNHIHSTRFEIIEL